MDRLRYLENLLTVLDQGSFSAAARLKGISQPAISQQMAALEQQYGLPLVQRTSTGVLPTRAGAIVARHAQILVEDHRAMQAELKDLDQNASGELRISMSQFLSQSAIGEAIQATCARHPDLRLILKAEDRLVDVVREGYDLAVRTGTLGDTTGLARRIARMRTELVAAPDYLDRVGRPLSPDDLRNLAHIQYSEHRTNGVMPLIRDGEEIEAPIVNGLVVDAPRLFISAVESGFGFARVPVILAEEMRKTCQLETVLPEYQVRPKDVFLVYPHRHALTPAAILVIETVMRELAQIPFVDVVPQLDLVRAA